MRKLGDEASERPGARGEEVGSSAQSARETREGGVEKPLQKLIEKILGREADKEADAQEGHIGDQNSR